MAWVLLMLIWGGGQNCSYRDQQWHCHCSFKVEGVLSGPRITVTPLESGHSQSWYGYHTMKTKAQKLREQQHRVTEYGDWDAGSSERNPFPPLQMFSSMHRENCMSMISQASHCSLTHGQRRVTWSTLSEFDMKSWPCIILTLLCRVRCNRTLGKPPSSRALGSTGFCKH